MSFNTNATPSVRPGFIRSIDPKAARRQFAVSFGVVGILALAIGGSAIVIRPSSGYDVTAQRAGIADGLAVNHRSMNADIRSGRMNGG